jgi:hypothetical protein
MVARMAGSLSTSNARDPDPKDFALPLNFKIRQIPRRFFNLLIQPIRHIHVSVLPPGLAYLATLKNCFRRPSGSPKH